MLLLLIIPFYNSNQYHSHNTTLLMLLKISSIRLMFQLLLTRFQCLTTYTNLFMILIDQYFSQDTLKRMSLMINRESESCSSRFAYLEHHLFDEMQLFCELSS
jgi:hypothetical protein